MEELLQATAWISKSPWASESSTRNAEKSLVGSQAIAMGDI